MFATLVNVTDPPPHYFYKPLLACIRTCLAATGADQGQDLPKGCNVHAIITEARPAALMRSNVLNEP